MKYAFLIFLICLVQGVSAQTPKTKVTPTKKTVASKPEPTATPTPVPLSEKEQFEMASAHELAVDRVAALEKFLADFPTSESRPAAADLMTSSRVLIAEEKLISGDTAGAVALFKRIVEEAPQPIPKDLFNESIAKIPSTLLRRGLRAEAVELASIIEARVENETPQLLEIGSFYLSMENGGEAMRVAAKAVAKDPTSSAAYRTLALAYRMNFDIEESAAAYAKALELDPESSTAKRGLAEMKRASGSSSEAVALYRDMLGKNDADIVARTGLVLALFDAGKRSEAETELNIALERAPGNFVLLAGAAYWYASRGEGNRAVELAENALKREPRYIWSHIAYARGLMAQGKPVTAEQVLVAARAYGNFPTLEYEIASARMAAGFYREAAEDLARHFTLSDGGVKTKLGGRVLREEKSLYDLVAYERKASIFAPSPADTLASAETLRALLDLDHKLLVTKPDEAGVVTAAEAFIRGSDKMKLYRQIYAATALLRKGLALREVLEIARSATGTADSALDVPSANSAVMASELYDARQAASQKNQFLPIPEVPRPTLSAILRGRIEEIAGWALYQQGNYPEATIRLRRALSVMPDKSAWWRSSMWRLGAALAADGKEAEALNYYIDSYKTDKPDFAKYAVVESLYRKLNGTTDGLEAKIGADRVAILQPTVDPNAQVAPQEPAPATISDPSESTKPATITADPPIEVTPDQPKPSGETVTDPPKAEPAETRTQAPADKERSVDLEPAKIEPATVVPIDPVPGSNPDAKKTDATEDKSGPVAEVKTEPAKPPDPNATKKPEPNFGPPSSAVQRTAEKTAQANTKNESISKPLFEPVIITVPDRRLAKSAQPGSADTKPAATQGKAGDTEAIDTSRPARPRVIEGQDVKLDQGNSCAVEFSQDSVSLINNGGSVGILVTLKGVNDMDGFTTLSSSPRDVRVTPEPEIAGFPNRRFFVIKSISEALGIYHVSFVAPCGKRDLIVTVR